MRATVDGRNGRSQLEPQRQTFHIVERVSELMVVSDEYMVGNIDVNTLRHDSVGPSLNGISIDDWRDHCPGASTLYSCVARHTHHHIPNL